MQKKSNKFHVVVLTLISGLAGFLAITTTTPSVNADNLSVPPPLMTVPVHEGKFNLEVDLVTEKINIESNLNVKDAAITINHSEPKTSIKKQVSNKQKRISKQPTKARGDTVYIGYPYTRALNIPLDNPAISYKPEVKEFRIR